MLRPTDHFADLLDRPELENLNWNHAEQALIPFETNPPFRHYASELLEMLGFTEFEEILAPIERAMLACQTTGIPEDQHFKQIYRFNSLSMSLRCDYKLTPLAAYLVTVNANPANINVAKAQVYFFLKSQ
jgi:hypothetical protein